MNGREEQAKRIEKWEEKMKEHEREDILFGKVKMKKRRERVKEEVIEKLKELNEQNWYNRRKSRYNKKYEWIRIIGISQYLKKRGGANEIKVVVRFRGGNESKSNL